MANGETPKKKSAQAEADEAAASQEEENTAPPTTTHSNGGGDDNVHSRVVADSPQGLSPATRFFMNASMMHQIKIRIENAEMYDPIEDT